MNIAEAVSRLASWESREDFPFVTLSGYGEQIDDPFDESEHPLRVPAVFDRWPQGAAAAACWASRLSVRYATTDDDLRDLLRQATQYFNGERYTAHVVFKWMYAHDRYVMPALGLPWSGIRFCAATSRRIVQVTPARARAILDLDEGWRDKTPAGGMVDALAARIQAGEWTARDPDGLMPPQLQVRYHRVVVDGRSTWPPIPGEFRLMHGAAHMQAVIDADETVDIEMLFAGKQSAFEVIPWLPAATVQGSVLS